MKIKTNEASGPALDWMVAKAIGDYKPVAVPAYSTDWAQGGPIIERELCDMELLHDKTWRAFMWVSEGQVQIGVGATPLIAAMRCYVSSKLGEEVEVPEGL